MKKFALACLIVLFSFAVTACSMSDTSVGKIAKPEKSTQGEMVYPAQNATAAEEASNVNGMRYTTNLENFTTKYNNIIKKNGLTDYLTYSNWKKSGDTTKDTKGVDIDYYYYKDEKINFTATIETETQKIMNIGCGTTMTLFVSKVDDKNFSDTVLQKSACMAAAVCGFSSDSLDVVQDIFYRTTFDGTNSLWYQGNIFNLTTNEANGNNEGTMLFRVFPITDELNKEWKVQSYEDYIASATENTEPSATSDLTTME